MTYLLFATGLVTALIGAEIFVRAATAIATRLGVPPLLIGLTIVAWGTSSPELAVSVRASLLQESGVALGNVIGSNIFNVGFILGLAAIVHPLRVQLSVIRLDAPILTGLTMLFCLLYLRGPLSRADGALLLAAFVAYTVVTFSVTRGQVPSAVIEEFEREQPRTVRNLSLAALGIVGGLGLLLYGGQLLVDQAVVLARATGISERVIGLTIVAAGTSLPELLTTLVAAAHCSTDIALGNIIGSNIFNLAAIVGISSVVAPIHTGMLTPLDLGALAVSSVILLPLMRTDFSIERGEGVLLLVAYVAYVFTLFAW